MDEKDRKILKIMSLLGVVVLSFVIIIMLYVFLFDDTATPLENEKDLVQGS
jgi:amino acid permease